MEKFRDYLGAGYPVLWVHTPEEIRAINAMYADLKQMDEPKRTGYWWDLGRGWCELKTVGKSSEVKIESRGNDVKDPLKALEKFHELADGAVLFLPDFHTFLNTRNMPSLCRQVKNMAPDWKARSKAIVIVSPVISVPVELEKDITVMDFPLPTVEELQAMASGLIEGNADVGRRVRLGKNAMLPGRGLTLNEAENAVALSLRKTGDIDKNILEQEKLQAVRKTGLMEIWEPVPISELGGLDNLKAYIERRKIGFTDMDKPAPKGILLVGLPGAGKSLSAKCISSVLGFPLVRLDIGSLKGSLVGESEAKMKRALSIIDSISPCVILMDEVEKALGGVQSSNRTDGGTTSNMFSQLLTWMQESRTRRYLVGTCNDISDILAISQGAFLRRFDTVFWVDMPTVNERIAILKIMNKRYGTKIPEEKAGVMENWTGAEIEKFVVDSVYDGEDAAFENVKPVYLQNQDSIAKARSWAENNARWANAKDGKEAKHGRRVSAAAAGTPA